MYQFFIGILHVTEHCTLISCYDWLPSDRYSFVFAGPDKAAFSQLMTSFNSIVRNDNWLT